MHKFHKTYSYVAQPTLNLFKSLLCNILRKRPKKQNQQCQSTEADLSLEFVQSLQLDSDARVGAGTAARLVLGGRGGGGGHGRGAGGHLLTQ